MKKILVIGSTVADIIIKVDHLPRTAEDVHILSQTMSLGGCAYNVSDSIRHFKVPYILFSPVGKGTYGTFVREALAAHGITSPIPTPDKENGCCYCFVERNGERTFLSYHGAEYLFEKEWFDLLCPEEIDSIYLCGLELEESSGYIILDWLEAHPKLPVYFAPGPRITRLTDDKLQRLYALSPVLHLNEAECLEASSKASVEEAAAFLHSLTHNTVIVTLGEKGAYYHSHDTAEFIPGVTAIQTDTIGAGDSHIGTIMASLFLGSSLREAVITGNKVAAAVVGVLGALLPDEVFNSLCR